MYIAFDGPPGSGMCTVKLQLNRNEVNGFDNESAMYEYSVSVRLYLPLYRVCAFYLRMSDRLNRSNSKPSWFYRNVFNVHVEYRRVSILISAGVSSNSITSEGIFQNDNQIAFRYEKCVFVADREELKRLMSLKFYGL